MATLKEIIQYSKANPNSDYAKNAYQLIQRGDFDAQAQKEGIDLSFAGRPAAPAVEQPKGLGQKILDTGKTIAKTVASSEIGLGNDIAAASTAILPKSVTGVQQLEEAQKSHADMLNRLADTIHTATINGADTSRLKKALEQELQNTPGDVKQLYPALNKTTLQVLGDIGGTALDLLSAGSYGTAAKGAEAGKLLVKGGGVVENLATKVGIPTTEKVSSIVSKDIAQKTLTETLKGIGKKTVARSAVGAGTGYAYDVSQNLKDGAQGADVLKPGSGALFGGVIPLAIGGIEAGVAVTKSLAPRVINSLVKPKAADFAYGKDPGRTVSELGITGNNFDDFANNINTEKNKIGEKIGAVYSNPENAKLTINAEDEITKLDEAIKEAAKGGKNNQGIVTSLQNVKDALLYEHTVNADGVIEKVGTEVRDLSNLSPEQAFALKQEVANKTQFTGRASDDKTVNSILKNIYGGLKEKLNTTVGINNPEITKLNQQFADLTSAEIAVKNREAIVKRAALISVPIKIGTAAGIITAITTGGAAIPAILAGAGAGLLDKALESTAVKTRIAAWLGKESPSVIADILQKNPEIKTILYRALPKFASELGYGQ